MDDAGELGSREGVFSRLQHRMQSLLFHKKTIHTGAGCRRAAGSSNATHKNQTILGSKYILHKLQKTIIIYLSEHVAFRCFVVDVNDL